MVEKMNKKKHPMVRNTLLGAAATLIIMLCVYSYFGGIGTGRSADKAEFAKYAGEVGSISIPAEARVIAFGEATHGNAEFQQLRLDVFKKAVTENGVKAFGLEGDAGGCEVVNRYIHGGEGTAEEAAAAIGFEIYRTPETAQLISWMREYNETAEPGGDLRFYGFDMQRIENNYKFLLEGAKKYGVDAAALEEIWDGDGYSDAFDRDYRKEVIENVKAQLEVLDHADTTETVYFADILLQNIELGKVVNFAAEGNVLRDRLMAQNALRLLEREEQRGPGAIFLAGHVGHMAQFGNYTAEDKIMGNILADKLGDGYFVIGTEFYRSKCNLPKANGSGRAGHVFYSRDPLAKAAKKCGYDECWLDFSAVPQDSALYGDISNYTWQGKLGDVAYSPILMSLLPQCYRVWQCPSQLYDGMIFVSNAHPTVVAEAE